MLRRKSLLFGVAFVACGGPPAADPSTPDQQASDAGAPFAMHLAAQRLKNAVENLQDCKLDDLVGEGRVRVIFARSGEVQSATVHGTPFEGTRTAGCVEAHMRQVQVPPFDGPPFPVDKRFSIQ